jgi:L-ascorbate metabolism protein UlaG (beta-lactamase superfamily)
VPAHRCRARQLAVGAKTNEIPNLRTLLDTIEITGGVITVVGFVLSAPGVPTVYFSGDNSELDVVEEIAAKFLSIDVAVLNVGGAKFDVLAHGAYITLSNERALEAAKILKASKVIAVHEDSWAHFSQNAEEVRALFDANGLGSAIIALQPGEACDVEL